MTNKEEIIRQLAISEALKDASIKISNLIGTRVIVESYRVVTDEVYFIGVTMEDIANSVCEVHKVSLEALQSPDRHTPIRNCRYHAIALIRKHFGTAKSLKAIGKFFNRDHSTIINALDTHNDFLSQPYERGYNDLYLKSLSNYLNLVGKVSLINRQKELELTT
jgi:chromosomal replication initiation ATPase DnaA